jgi:hypothetical protein
MTLPIETKYIATAAKIDSLELKYSSCLSEPDIANKFTSIKSSTASIKDTAVDAVTDKINTMTNGKAMYGLQCAAQALPSITDTLSAFQESLNGLTALSAGTFLNKIDNSIDGIPDGLSCPELLTYLESTDSLCTSILSDATSLINEYVSLESLQDLIVDSLGTVGVLLGCGLSMFDNLSGLSSSITDINTTLKNGISAVTEAKNIGTSPIDVSVIAKENMVSKMNLDTQMSSVKSNFVSKIAALGS